MALLSINVYALFICLIIAALPNANAFHFPTPSFTSSNTKTNNYKLVCNSNRKTTLFTSFSYKGVNPFDTRNNNKSRMNGAPKKPKSKVPSSVGKDPSQPSSSSSSSPTSSPPSLASLALLDIAERAVQSAILPNKATSSLSILVAGQSTTAAPLLPLLVEAAVEANIKWLELTCLQLESSVCSGVEDELVTKANSQCSEFLEDVDSIHVDIRYVRYADFLSYQHI